jgi:hypothetical protein
VNVARMVYEPPAMAEVGEFTDLTCGARTGPWTDFIFRWDP